MSNKYKFKIGNLVCISKYSKINIILTEELNSFVFINNLWDLIKPIQVDEDILLHIGYTKELNVFSKISFPNIINDEDGNYYIQLLSKKKYVFYLHELQNM